MNSSDGAYFPSFYNTLFNSQAIIFEPQPDMSYPPNSPIVAKRGPQHGINITNTPPPRLKLDAYSSPHTTKFWDKSPSSKNVLAVNCTQNGCSNTVAVVPFGHHEGAMHVKVRCKECQIPILMARKEYEVPEDWAGCEWEES